MNGVPATTDPIVPSLCSVTFRGLSPDEIVRLAEKNGIRSIEWGSDVHVPAGDGNTALRVATTTKAAGLLPVSYGSYIRAGDEGATEAFDAVLGTAVELGAGNIRVWAGRQSGRNAAAEQVKKIARDLRLMAAMARDSGITVSVEYHRDTQTEHASDTMDMLDAVGHENLFAYWQPVPGRGRAAWLAELELLQPHLGFVHVFQWLPARPRDERRLLREGHDDWQALLAAWTPAKRWPHGRHAMLEFVAGDDPAAFTDDAAELRRLCRGDGDATKCSNEIIDDET